MPQRYKICNHPEREAIAVGYAESGASQCGHELVNKSEIHAHIERAKQRLTLHRLKL